ncbi:uncharacterized protein LOC120730671 isoform X2 [Simochromis diagramma]|uniref:uncharacterized protein LOC120730671 isoform X2 n=1 Tax=Simochromis diagramma TaxID=43689 RepID=UPI001A7EC04E|nr:uncharacterized protein LOC120730671 isoform X2 [Simochromis diagramma]
MLQTASTCDVRSIASCAALTRMEDGPSFASTNGSAECTVADGTDAFNPAHKKEVKSRGLLRLEKLRRHHSVCEQRYERAQSKRLNDQRERTLFLHRSLNTKMEQQLSSDSDSSIIIEHTSADSDVDTSVPELRRTDSVIVSLFVQLHYRSQIFVHRAQSE